MRRSTESRKISDTGFPRSARLLTSADFQRVFSKPKRLGDAFFTLLFISNGGGPARLGMAVSKRQVKRAVDRTRLKRLVRESFRIRRHALAGLDLVVMMKSAAASTDKVRLNKSLARMMDRLQTVAKAESGSTRPLEPNAPASDPG